MRHTELFMGRIGVIEDVKELANNNCVVNFSVAETPRVKNGDNWEDGVTIWTNISIFGDEARNLHRSVKPGTFVMVYGERTAREYTPKDSTEKRTVQSIVARQVGIGITKFAYVEGMGNVHYAKDGYTATAGTSQGSTAGTATTATAKTETVADTGGDPFGGGENPFGGDDDDPFSLKDA